LLGSLQVTIISPLKILLRFGLRIEACITYMQSHTQATENGSIGLLSLRKKYSVFLLVVYSHKWQKCSTRLKLRTSETKMPERMT